MVSIGHILKGEMSIFIFDQISAHTAQQLLLSRSFNSLDIISHKPEMQVADVIAIHLVLNQLRYVYPVTQASAFTYSYILSAS